MCYTRSVKRPNYILAISLIFFVTGIFFPKKAAALPTNFIYQNWCQVGGQNVILAGLPSTTLAQQSYPNCTVSVYLTGTQTLATIFSDVTGTVLANPFTANNDASFRFYAAGQIGYDITISGAGMTAPYTFPSVFLGIGGGGTGALFPSTSAVVVNTSTLVSRNAVFGDIVTLFGGGTCSGFLKNDGTCATSTSTPAGSNQEVQVNVAGSFGVDPFFLNNATTHNTLSRQLNNIPYVSQYQTGGGGNGAANFFAAAGGNQTAILDIGDGTTENTTMFNPATPDNSMLIDLRPPSGQSGLGAAMPGWQSKNCTTGTVPWPTAQSVAPTCGQIYTVFTDSSTANNVSGANALVIGGVRYGSAYNYGGFAGGSGSPWTVSSGLAVATADFGPGITNTLFLSQTKNGTGDTNLLQLDQSLSGGTTAGADQGNTAIGFNGGQFATTAMAQVASFSGTAPHVQVVQTPFPGTNFYSTMNSGLSEFLINFNAKTPGASGGVTGAYLYIFNPGSGMAAGTYTVSCTGGGGSGATIQVVANGQVTTNPANVTVLTAGSGYTSAPTCNSWSPAPGGNLATIIATVALQGTMVGSTPVPGSTYLNMMQVSGVTLSPSTGDCLMSSALVPSSNTPGTYQTDTVTCVVQNNHPIVPGLMWSTSNETPERLNVLTVSGGTTTGSTQTLTVQHIAPIATDSTNPTNFYQGGTQGCFELDANFVEGTFFTCYFAFGAYDSTHLIYGSLAHGNMRGNFLPGGAANDGGNMRANLSSPYNTFHVFEGANILYVNQGPTGNQGSNFASLVLGVNDVPWQANDFINNGTPSAYDTTIILGSFEADTPADNGDAGLLFNFQGQHWNGALQALRFINNNDPNIYYSWNHSTGFLTSPNGIEFQGIWNQAIFMDHVPSTNLIQVNDGGVKYTVLQGSLGLTSDAPNNRWDIGGAGLMMQGSLFTNYITYSENPSIGGGNQVLQSVDGAGGASFYSQLGDAFQDATGIFSAQEVDASTVRAGSTAPITFFIAGSPTAGSTTYSWVATSTTAAGETLPTGTVTSTTGPSSLSSSNFYFLRSFTRPGSNGINVYRTAGPGGTGLICHITLTGVFTTGCSDIGQTAGAAVPTVDTSGTLTGANATFTGVTSSAGGIGPLSNVLWTTGSGAPSGSCTNGSLYTSFTGTTTNILWACGSSSWQLVH